MKPDTKKGPDILIRLLAVLGMVLMSACSNATPPSSTQTGSPPPVSSATEPHPNDIPLLATPDRSSGNVTITFANLQPDQGINYQKLAAAPHRQNPSITVTVIPVDHSVPLADAYTPSWSAM